MTDHTVGFGDLVRVEYLLGRSLQFLVYGLVTHSQDNLVVVLATYVAEVPAQFDTIRLPADQVRPGAETVIIDHGYERLVPGDSFEIEIELDLAVHG